MTKEPEWIEWNGGECPVPDGADCEVSFREGGASRNCEPKEWNWEYWGGPGEILFYRVWPDENEATPPPAGFADLKVALGVAIHGLNLAASQIERMGGDASIQREIVAEIKPLRGLE